VPSSHSRQDAPHSRTRRYVFHADSFVTCTLVWKNGQWHVKKESGGRVVRLPLSEFEQTDTGKRLSARLKEALTKAQQDA
jgi:hypothetical protein